MFNKKAIIIVLIICLAGVFAMGCAKKVEKHSEEPEKDMPQVEQPEVNPLTVKDLYPLEEGNYWKFTGEGNEYAAFEQKVLFKKGNRVQLQVVSAGTTMGMIYEFVDGKLVVVFSQEELYEEENILDKENEMSQVILQEPITVGASWESGGRTYKIEEIDAVVNTPAGEFSDCVKISNTSEDDNSKSYVYYKPGLGLVKQEFVSDENKIIAKLEEYNVPLFR